MVSSGFWNTLAHVWRPTASRLTRRAPRPLGFVVEKPSRASLTARSLPLCLALEPVPLCLCLGRAPRRQQSSTTYAAQIDRRCPCLRLSSAQANCATAHLIPRTSPCLLAPYPTPRHYILKYILQAHLSCGYNKRLCDPGPRFIAIDESFV